MRCVNPFVDRRGAYGCGQCMPCRFNRRRTWTHRLMLEAMCHGDNAFVTLTYGDEVRELNPDTLRNWFKRLRKRIEPRRIRYYAVGEYGDISFRPHYHAALFGFPHCYGERSRGECQCGPCSVVRQTWGLGHVMVGRLEMKSAQYLAGYVTKKMTMRDDPRLLGRHPEFARMSLGSRKDGRGGIGAFALHDVASVIMQYRLEEGRDVPMALAHNGRELPLGRYLRSKLRLMCGKDEKTPESSLQEVANKLSIVRQFAFDNSRSVKSVFQEINEPYAAQLEGREKLKERRL